MDNKVLIKLIVPELDAEFNIFIPVNELVWKVKKLMLKSISDLTENTFNSQLDFEVFNKDTGVFYGNNQIIIDTDIRNGSELVFLSRM